jgi:integrase
MRGKNYAGDFMKRHKSFSPCVFFYQHKSRKHGSKFDRYFVIRHRVDGKQLEEGLGWASEKWTDKKAAAVLAELNHNKTTGQGPRTLKERKAAQVVEAMSDITVKVFWETDYINILKSRCKRASWEKELQHYQLRILPEMGNRPLKSIARVDVERLVDKMRAAGLAPRTIIYLTGTLSRVWKHAARRKLVKAGDNPALGIELQKINNARLRVLSPDELNKILSYLALTNPATHDLTFFCAFTGCRLSEAAKLTWEFVNLVQGSVVFADTKNKDTREIFIVDEVSEMLRHRGPGNAGEYVFTRKNGRPFLRETNMDTAETPTAFKTAVKNLGLNEGRGPRDRVVFHSLRHTAATYVARRGTPVKDLQLLFGWKTPSMVFRYVKGNLAEQRMAMEGLASALQEKKAVVIPFFKSAKQ